MSEQSIFARLLFALAGHSRTGLRLKPIADGIGESPAPRCATCSDWPRTAWSSAPLRPGQLAPVPRIVQIALAHQAEVAREERQLDDFKNRYSRSPN